MQKHWHDEFRWYHWLLAAVISLFAVGTLLNLLIDWRPVVRFLTRHDKLSGWAQALGGAAAIGGAFLIAHLQHKATLAREAERERLLRKDKLALIWAASMRVREAVSIYQEVLENQNFAMPAKVRRLSKAGRQGGGNSVSGGGPQALLAYRNELEEVLRRCALEARHALEPLPAMLPPAEIAVPLAKLTNLVGALDTLLRLPENLEQHRHAMNLLHEVSQRLEHARTICRDLLTACSTQEEIARANANLITPRVGPP